ncbi:hypothetical protein [Hyphomonas johnsonii]|uniref:Uncharacterized protein n=1 Tax=Hyphomonas johnsonii MHS-2 TaxID=1280950 RepID=A0A059FHG2_9PROT|nr:hypothetical protein [Hyphomonas johnsonii]KCZ90027.1 hypothetical protein HJO_13796 [Hyphomonas johnsonii MHS-2]
MAHLISTAFRFTGTFLAGAMLSACISLTPDQVYPLGSTLSADPSLVANLDAPLESTIRTAKSGEIILKQSVQNTSVMILENTVTPVGDVSLAVQARSVELTEGLAFYPAISFGKENALVACSFDRPAVWTPRLNPGASGQGKVCFELEKIAGKIDFSQVGQGLGGRSSSVFFFVSDRLGFAEPSGPYEKLFRWDPQLTYEVSEPARFRTMTPTESAKSRTPNIALRFISTEAGGQIKPVYLAGDQPVGVQADPIVIGADQDFPIKIRYDGADIEILALKEGVLAYRVLSGFTTGATYILDLPESATPMDAASP